MTKCGKQRMENNKVNIDLSKDQDVVLLEFLARLNQKELKELFEDQAEQRVLWDLEASLEKQLLEPFGKDYSSIVTTAREAVKDKE